MFFFSSFVRLVFLSRLFVPTTPGPDARCARNEHKNELKLSVSPHSFKEQKHVNVRN